MKKKWQPGCSCCDVEPVTTCDELKTCFEGTVDNDFDGDVEVEFSDFANESAELCDEAPFKCVDLNDTWLFVGPHAIDTSGGNCCMNDAVLLADDLCFVSTPGLTWSIGKCNGVWVVEAQIIAGGSPTILDYHWQLTGAAAQAAIAQLCLPGGGQVALPKVTDVDVNAICDVPDSAIIRTIP